MASRGESHTGISAEKLKKRLTSPPSKRPKNKNLRAITKRRMAKEVKAIRGGK